MKLCGRKLMSLTAAVICVCMIVLFVHMRFASPLRLTFSAIGHQGSIISIAYSTDGRYMVTLGSDKSCVVWEAATGKIIRRITSNAGDMCACAISPDGNTLALAYQDGMVQVRSMFSDESIRHVDVHIPPNGNGWPRFASTLAFSPIGDKMAVGTSDGIVQLWDMIDLVRLDVVDRQQFAISSVLYSRAGDYLAIRGENASVTSYAIGDGKLTRIEKGTPICWWGHSLAISSDATKLSYNTHSQGVYVCDMTTMTMYTQLRLPQQSPATRMAFGYEDKTLVTVHQNGKIAFWDMQTGQHTFSMTVPGAVSLAYCVEGKRLACGSNDGRIHVWDFPYKKGVPR